MPRRVSKALEELLSAYVALFTQPFEQDIGASVRAAALSISLGGLEGLMLLVRDGAAPAVQFGESALVLILVWIAVTAALAGNRVLTIARNLSVLSFWIAGTMVFVFAVELVFTDPLARGIRLLSCILTLWILVPVHLIRGKVRFPELLWMTLFLWSSTGFLAFRLIY